MRVFVLVKQVAEQRTRLYCATRSCDQWVDIIKMTAQDKKIVKVSK